MVIVSFRRVVRSPDSGGRTRDPAAEDYRSQAPVLRFRVWENVGVDASASKSISRRQTTGLHTWPSALLLGALVVEMGFRGELRDRSIVELGAGTGISGLCAALSSNCHRVTLTDGDPKVLQNLERTVSDLKDNFRVRPVVKCTNRAASAGLALKKGDRSEDNSNEGVNKNNTKSCPKIGHIDVKELEWGLTQLEDLHSYDADIILGADCLYERTSWDDFLATVHAMLVYATKKRGERSQRPRFLGCHQLRNSSHTLAPYLAHWGLQARPLPVPNIVGLTETDGIATSCQDDVTLGLFELTLDVCKAHLSDDDSTCI